MRHLVTDSSEWRHWVTPKQARGRSIHRWYLFPHSFTDDLVRALIDDWGLSSSDRLLDPFAGAGTTLLASKEANVPAQGYDISPLAVLATNTKTATYRVDELKVQWGKLQTMLFPSVRLEPVDRYPELIHRALPEKRLEVFHAIASCIEQLGCLAGMQNFFRLALISLIPRFSHAIANGGWLRWSYQGKPAELIMEYYVKQVEMMLEDLQGSRESMRGKWRASIADARSLPDKAGQYTAVVTSPPYPNRHDYTRVFGVELMFAFLNWRDVRAMRYQSFHSHPEARPTRPPVDDYVPPKKLQSCLESVTDGRLRKMLHGYFMDMYLCLREMKRVCREGARLGLVVGNVQYNGEPVMVDEFTAELGERIGFACREIRAVRWRGNSAQQMGKYGRRGSRESVVLFEKG